MRVIAHVAVLALFSVPAIASESSQQPRQGFGISFGLGGGSAGVDCSGCTNDRETGFSGYLRLGGYVRPDLLVAFESNGFVTSSGGADTNGALYSVALQWYPNVNNGFYWKGNLGVAALVEDGPGYQAEVAALGVGVGTGYDIRLGRNFSLTPYANLIYTAKADAKLDGASTGVKLGFNLLQVGLGFTWH